MDRFRQAVDAARRPAVPAPGLPELRRGDSGPAVERIQRWLGVVGPGDPGYGQFGPLTERKVREYQQMRGIPVTGVVDVATYREMGLK